MHLHTEFGANSCIQFGVIDIFQNPRWRPQTDRHQRYPIRDKLSPMKNPPCEIYGSNLQRCLIVASTHATHLEIYCCYFVCAAIRAIC